MLWNSNATATTFILSDFINKLFKKDLAKLHEAPDAAHLKQNHILKLKL